MDGVAIEDCNVFLILRRCHDVTGISWISGCNLGCMGYGFCGCREFQVKHVQKQSWPRNQGVILPKGKRAKTKETKIEMKQHWQQQQNSGIEKRLNCTHLTVEELCMGKHAYVHHLTDGWVVMDKCHSIVFLFCGCTLGDSERGYFAW